jgi:predicted RNase H-like HicB family nuclease
MKMSNQKKRLTVHLDFAPKATKRLEKLRTLLECDTANVIKQSLQLLEWVLDKDMFDDRVDDYTYNTFWSKEDKTYVAQVEEFGLKAHGDSPEVALREIRFLVNLDLKDIDKTGEKPPQPNRKGH